MFISKSLAKKILKNAGAEKVSPEACEELARIIDIYSYSIAKRAVRLCKHAKRRTLRREDIKVAAEK
ncbi:MAG: NFYB/HAP3 family transcription factor subunit [Candidatus Micrarchaeaceae archaeon]